MNPTPYTASPADLPGVALPPAFEAFYALHQARYLTYARAQLPPGPAVEAVRTAFGALVIGWSAVVGSPNPTARAWDFLSYEVRRRDLRRSARPADASCVLHEDVRVLAALGFTPETSADITGRDPSKIRYLAARSTTCTHPASCERGCDTAL
ncbi:hypothetical protein KPP03845_106978 [Streptomyces xanthophaeus]|uniref:hypothetical protein n=1 Tax=Streptomyces xanthophaeus TaxID=67385 RepID=UPI00233EBAA0|nr:hypothetical protein [Streptomyces xanthophaeus]WCD90550.1 hypothetical protein KPP03845_106978 [Streptomyces xanthophaeus]